MTLFDIISLVLGILLLAMAFFAINSKKLINSVLFLSGLSMLAVVSFVLMKAPDVAITEAVIGSGLVTALFVFTLLSIRKGGSKMKNFLGLVLALILGVFMILALDSSVSFPEFGSVDVNDRVSAEYFDMDNIDEVGSANIVTAIVVGYRGFDTLGEVTVLFISALGVALIFASKGQKRLELKFKPNFMLKTGSKIIFGIILVTSLYIVLHGHLTPGGGFPGGAMIASAILLLYLADDKFRGNIKSFKILEGVAGSLFVIIGLLGLVFATYFLQNFIPQGTVGELLSAGIIPIIYVLVGLKVGSEITGIIDNFLTEEESA